MATGDERRRASDRTLTRESFAALLYALSPDIAEAARRYEYLRTRLIRIFTWERCPSPEEHTDEAINRVARRLSQGEHVQDLDAYFFGVARLLVREIRGQMRVKERATEDYARSQQTRDARSEEAVTTECLRRCMEDLKSSDKDMLMEYYSENLAAKIEVRRRLATSLQISANTLRNRALRLRQKLEECVRNCLRSGDV